MEENKNKDIHTLIIPDVHCRNFWIKPVHEVLEKYPETKIVFLGDYLDGYSHDWDDDFDYIEHGFQNFLKIIELKEKYNDRIILLQGNHDCCYSIGVNICNTRTDYKHMEKLQKIFKEKRNLFQLVYSEKINNTNFLFSHAGVNKQWVDFNFKDLNINKENIVDFLNNIWLNYDVRKLNTLGQYDNYRGWFGYDYGSPIWADFRAMININKKKSYDFYQIVGHTQLNNGGNPIISKNIGCLDCKCAFYINNNGEIKKWEE